MHLAKRCNGEIINADAMQLYGGLPIITNKATSEEQDGVPHHLLGCIGLREPTWVVGRFVKEALNVIDGIRARGRVPILVGGTHYYTQSLLFHDRLADEEGNGESTEADAQPEEETSMLEQPTEVLLAELRKVDPVMADRWHPNDRRKIRRSLEICMQTGEKASDVYAKQRLRKQQQHDDDHSASDTLDEPMTRFQTLIFWIHAEHDALRERLDRRVDKMLQQGLLDEVRTLKAFEQSEAAEGRPVDETRGIWVSIGYKEFKDYVHALETSVDDPQSLKSLHAEALERIKAATRQYAKRQVRWIRIKLINSLKTANATNSLFLLDGSDLASFQQLVAEPATELARQFLQAAPMPDPTSLSRTAAELLIAKQDYDLAATPEKWAKHYCEICDKTCVTEGQWEQHQRSKAHRNMKQHRRRLSKPSEEGAVADAADMGGQG